MITAAHVETMAAYNRWQNGSLYAAAESIGDAARREDRGAFFGPIHATLSHVLWADQIWMSRFDTSFEKPDVGIAGSTELHDDWQTLHHHREAFDARILEWAGAVDEAWLAADLSWYSGAAGRDVTKPAWLLVTHVFNHQTHHRGQVHAMLTAAGARPGDTDLFLMPE